MNSSKPYLARAIYEWIVDNNLTPYVVILTHVPGVRVPQQYVQDGQIILNTAPEAVQKFLIDNEAIAFNARFGGVGREIYAPIQALSAIYAKENGRGMVFGDEDGGGDSPEPTEPKKDKPKLTLVKK